MEVNRLLADELVYELTIRGLPIRNTVQENRSTLRGALRLERDMGSSLDFSMHLNPQIEINVCHQKLQILGQDVESFDMSNKNNEYKRISTRLCHLQMRLRRIPTTSEEVASTRNQLLTDCFQLLDHLGQLMDNCEDMTRTIDVQPVQDKVAPQRQSSSVPILDQNTVMEGSLIDHPLLLIPEIQDNQSESRHVEDQEQRIDINREVVAEARNSTMIRMGTNLLNDLEEVRAEVRQNNQDIGNLIRRYAPLHQDKCSDRNNPPQKDCEDDLQHLRFSLRPEKEPPLRSCYGYPLESRRPEIDIARTSYDRPGQSYGTRVTGFGDENTSVPKTDRDRLETLDGLERKFLQLERPSGFGIDISRWKIVFDGNSSVTNFIERLEELRLSRGVSKTQLLRSAPEFFSKDALHWYRIHQFTSWDELVHQLKTDFLPYDYEYELLEEIRNRTQGAKEKLITYVSSMENLFNKLGPSKPTEEVRIKMIRRNLLPYLQSQLALHETENISDLLRLGRAIEETAVRTQRYVPPPTNYKQLLEPGLAYHKPTGLSQDFHANVSAVAPGNSREKIEISAINCRSEITQEKEVRAICWNCEKTGHRFRKCTKPRRIFCFRCGQLNVTSNSCAKCTSKNGPERTQ